MNTRLALLLTATLALGAFASAQQPPTRGTPAARGAPGAGRAAPAAAQPAPAQTVNGQQVNANGPDGGSLAERVFNSDRWAIDPQTGTIVLGNMKFKVGDNMFVRARFQRYLTTPAPPDTEQKYQALLAKINDLLSVGNAQSGSKENLYQAWLLLFDAAKFKQDAGDSMIIANQVYNAWRIRDEKDQSLIDRAALDRDRKREEESLKNQTTSASTARLTDSTTSTSSRSARSTRSGGTVSGGPTASSNPGPNRSSGSTTTSGSMNVGPNGPTGGLNISSTTPNGQGNDLNSLMPAQIPTPTAGDLASTASGLSSMNLDRSKAAAAGDAFFSNLELLRTNTQMTAMDAKIVSAGLNAQLQFQTTILFFLMARKFEHTLIAGEFYRHIFKGSAQKVSVGQDEMSKMMDLRDVMPTIDTFEGIARNAKHDVANGMDSVNTTYDSGQRWQALQRLQETFILGEFQPAVLEFDPAKRQVLGALYRNVSDLDSLLDHHNLADAETVLSKIEADASDFPSTTIRSTLREQRQTSNLALISAKTAMLNNNLDQARQDIQTAIQIWPLNPEIPKFEESVAGRLDLGQLAQADFDKYLAQSAYRQIYNQRNEFGLALYNDPDRGPKLTAIIDRIAKVDTMIAYADAALKKNSGYAAWEMLVSASQLEPDDPALARAMSRTAPRVANFAAALDSAAAAEKAGKYAASLNYYLTAQDIYPASDLAHDGIDNLSKKLLVKMNPAGPTAKDIATGPAPADSANTTAASPAPAERGGNTTTRSSR